MYDDGALIGAGRALADGVDCSYRKLGFMRMRTAMAIFKNQDQAIRGGLVEET